MSNIVPLIKKEDLDSKVDLIKRTICKGSSDDELQLFIHACKRTGLDPFMKQIHAVKRGDVMTIQTGIDGLRLIADRSGNYAPGKEATFQYEGNGNVKSATAYIKKRTPDGEWHEVSATAFYSEYKPNYKNAFWENKPHIMLSKCAEALALRKAFPAEMSGLYTADEMDQAEGEKEGIQSTHYSQQKLEDEEYLLSKFVLENKIGVPEHFYEYVEFVRPKLKDRTMATVARGWLQEPEKCLNYYKLWLEKNYADDISSEENIEIINM